VLRWTPCCWPLGAVEGDQPGFRGEGAAGAPGADCEKPAIARGGGAGVLADRRAEKREGGGKRGAGRARGSVYRGWVGRSRGKRRVRGVWVCGVVAACPGLREAGLWMVRTADRTSSHPSRRGGERGGRARARACRREAADGRSGHRDQLHLQAPVDDLPPPSQRASAPDPGGRAD